MEMNESCWERRLAKAAVICCWRSDRNVGFLSCIKGFEEARASLSSKGQDFSLAFFH